MFEIEKVCPECGKPLAKNAGKQQIYHKECLRKRSSKKKLWYKKERERRTKEWEHKKRVYKEDDFWARIALAEKVLCTSYGKLEHEANKRGISIEQYLESLGV